MASVEKRGKKWLVRWRDPDGRERGRRCPDAATAKELARSVERSIALGRAWEPEDAVSDPALVELEGERVVGGLFADFLEAHRPLFAPGTRRHYDRALRRFAVFLAERNPRERRLSVELLTRDALQAWFGSLVDDRLDKALEISTARLYITSVASAWEWGYDSDDYGEHVSRPRRIKMPAVVTTPAVAPTWEQMDQAIAAAYRLAIEARTVQHRDAWLWRARLCTLLRFTGLRVDEQAMQLTWEDVDLDRGELTIRGELGKSRRERGGRIVPLSPHLVELMAGWGVREGLLLAPHKGARCSDPRHMAMIWEKAGVPKRVWGASSGRKKAQVHHAFRKGFKTGLAGLGAGEHVRDFLLGHHQGIDEHYLDTIEQAREAVGKIPPLDDDAAAGEVINLPMREAR